MQRLRVSDNRRYLVYEDGRPFFYLGDTAWELFHRLDREEAEAGPVPEGSIGAGTGTEAFGFKGGIGTASRVLPESHGGYTVGALVQSNFGGVLTIL